MFTLDQLRGFVAVAEELHFGRAAERLRMTQPPLSRQIQKLERSVGVQLLDRDNRNVELTTAGAAFLIEARRLLGLADGALDHVRRIHAGSAGTVRIGFTATAAFGVLHPEGFPQRALVLIGPDAVVRWSYEAGSPADLPGANLIFDAL